MEAFESNLDIHWTQLHTSTKTFEPETSPMEPIQIFDIPISCESQPSRQSVLRAQECRDLESLEEYLRDAGTGGTYSSRVISIAQKNPWSRLQITKAMLQRLIDHHDIHPSFLEVPLSFAHRTTDEEQSFCIPWNFVGNAESTQIFYTFRYAEYKGHPNEPWVLRQMGVYHSFNMQNKSSLLIMINAVANSIACRRVLESYSFHQRQLWSHPLWIHGVIHASYFMNWREYLAAYEKRLLPIADTTTATFISKPLRVSHDTLGEVRSLESRFLPVLAILTSFEEVLEGLDTLGAALVASGCVAQPMQQRAASQSANVQRYCLTFTRTALFLQAKSNSTAVLLADTLAFRNQGVAQEQNESIVVLTKAAVFITVITLIYLPWTLVTGIFGMEFFEMDPKTQSLGTSPQIWIYFLTAVCASIFTVALYYGMPWFWQDRQKSSPVGDKTSGDPLP